MDRKLIVLVLAMVPLLLSFGCTTQTGDQMPAGSGDDSGDSGGDDSGDSGGTASYVDVTAAEAKELIDTNPDLVVIDVSPHYANGHLPGAVNYYLGDGSLDAAIPTLDKSKDYLVYCHVDSVAIAGAQKLIDAGFTTVYRLEGNYAAWVAAGYPVET